LEVVQDELEMRKLLWPPRLEESQPGLASANHQELEKQERSQDPEKAQESWLHEEVKHLVAVRPSAEAQALAEKCWLLQEDFLDLCERPRLWVFQDIRPAVSRLADHPPCQT